MTKMFGRKILVEIITKSGELIRKRYPVKDGKIVIRKPQQGRGHAGYLVEYDRNSLLTYEWKPLRPIPWPNLLRHKVLLMNGADHTIDFKYNKEDDKATVSLPRWDRIAEEKLFEANVIKSSGSILQNIKIPPLFYIAIFITMAIGFLNFLIQTGRIRI